MPIRPSDFLAGPSFEFIPYIMADLSFDLESLLWDSLILLGFDPVDAVKKHGCTFGKDMFQRGKSTARGLEAVRRARCCNKLLHPRPRIHTRAHTSRRSPPGPVLSSVQVLS